MSVQECEYINRNMMTVRLVHTVRGKIKCICFSGSDISVLRGTMSKFTDLKIERGKKKSSV